MFAIVQNDTIIMLVSPGTPFELDEIQYPANWCNLSTPEEKASIGMVDVVYGERPSDKYYWISQNDPVYSNGVVVIDYIVTPKDLTVLKNNLISEINQQAYSILLPSDWMVVKSMETGVVVNSAWNIWRATIRQQAADQIIAINNCTTIDELSILPSVIWANDPNYIAR